MMYFFDLIDLFKIVLSSPVFQTKMHIGMADFVENPSELYELMAWVTLIRCCSRDYIFYPNSADPIFPSDIIYYRCSKDCFCTQGRKLYPGRIFGVGRDRTKNALTPALIKLLINPLYIL